MTNKYLAQFQTEKVVLDKNQTPLGPMIHYQCRVCGERCGTIGERKPGDVFKSFCECACPLAVQKLLRVHLGEIRVSKRGVPHLVFKDCSVSYFATKKIFRVFYPWPASSQYKFDFKTPVDVRKFLLANDFKDKP